MPRIVHCVRLKREAEGLDLPPYPGKLGQRIYEQVSKEAWLAWLEHQKRLINETRLNLAESQARKYVAEQMERHFFDAGPVEPSSIAGWKRLMLRVRRAHAPRHWNWLRNRFAALARVRVSAAKLALASSAAVTALYLGSGLFTVQPGEVAIRMRFGQIVSPDLGPGLHYRLPWPFETQRVVQKERVQRITVGSPGTKAQPIGPRPAEAQPTAAGWTPTPASSIDAGSWFQRQAAAEQLFLLTGDGNLIDLRWAVQYRVRDAVAYAFNIAEPETLIGSVSLTALNGIVARSGIDAIYTSERGSLEQQAARAIQRALDNAHAGVEVASFHLLYVHPPAEVHDAFRDVASAQEDKLRTVNRAHIFAVETVSQAKGEAAAMLEQALAFKEQQLLHAQGDSAGFLQRLGAYRHAPDLTTFRLQIETVEATLPGLQKFITPGAGEMKEFDMWLLQPVATGRSK